jgi:hypothetical protein
MFFVFNGNEDEMCAFFDCPEVRSSWNAAGLASVLISQGQQGHNTAERIFNICST